MATHRYELVISLNGPALDEYVETLEGPERPPPAAVLETKLAPIRAAAAESFPGMFERAFIRTVETNDGSSTRGKGPRLH